MNMDHHNQTWRKWILLLIAGVLLAVGLIISLPKISVVVGLVSTLVLALAIFLKEIYERKHIGGALRQSEAKYRSLIENLEQGVFLKDRAGRFLAANKHFCQSRSCAEADLLGKTDYDLLSP